MKFNGLRTSDGIIVRAKNDIPVQLGSTVFTVKAGTVGIVEGNATEPAKKQVYFQGPTGLEDLSTPVSPRLLELYC